MMKLSETLRSEASQIWDSFLVHPFVRGIGDGSLPVEKFKYYMIQDYLYLYDFIKIFALGIVKSDNEEMMRLFSDSVYSTLNGEMDIHRSYMARLGITEEELENSRVDLTNLSYTHYMLAIAHNGDVLDILVSILSCAWSYEEIGKHLDTIPGASENEFYGEWIRSYAGDDYSGVVRALIDMTDRLGENIDPKRRDKLIEIFVNCSRFEAMFWDMAFEDHTSVSSFPS